MRSITHVGALTVALALSPIAMAQPQPPTPAQPSTPRPRYDENTPFAVLMKDPAAKTVLIDDWPLVVTAIEMGGVEPTNTMKDAWNSESAHSKGGLTQALYDKVIADLKKL
jgi:hypothetical protein